MSENNQNVLDNLVIGYGIDNNGVKNGNISIYDKMNNTTLVLPVNGEPYGFTTSTKNGVDKTKTTLLKELSPEMIQTGIKLMREEGRNPDSLEIAQQSLLSETKDSKIEDMLKFHILELNLPVFHSSNVGVENKNPNSIPAAVSSVEQGRG